MKRNKLLFFSMLLIITISNAQITEGNWMVGGNGSFSSKENYNNNNKSDKGQVNELDISANLGYFFIDNLAIGTRIGYSNYIIPNSDGSGDRYWLNYGVFSRYYFLKPEKIMNIFIDGSYFLGQNSFGSGFDSFKNEINGYSFTAGPVVYFNSSVSMELALKYSSTKFSINNSTENNFQVGIGFQIYLEKL